MEIADLPLEIQDKIISHLDAVSLAKSRQVCRSWRNLHDQAKYRVLWQRACLRDISQDTLLELLGCDRGFFAALVKRESSIYRCAKDVYNTYPVGGVVGGASSTEQLSDGQVDWAEVYKKWYRSRKVSDWPHSVVSLHGSSAGDWWMLYLKYDKWRRWRQWGDGGGGGWYMTTCGLDVYKCSFYGHWGLILWKLSRRRGKGVPQYEKYR